MKKRYIMEVDGFGIFIAAKQAKEGVNTTTDRKKAMVMYNEKAQDFCDIYQRKLAKVTNNNRVTVHPVYI